jgi:hypothetical protein
MSQIERRNKKLTLKGLKYRLNKNKKLKCEIIKQNLMSDNNLTAENFNNLKSSVELYQWYDYKNKFPNTITTMSDLKPRSLTVIEFPGEKKIFLLRVYFF